MVAFSLEMSAAGILERMFCHDQHVDGNVLRGGRANEVNPEKWERFLERLVSAKLEILDCVGYSSKELETFIDWVRIADQREKFGDVLLIADHIQMCSSQGFAGKQEAIADYVRALKMLSVKHNIAILATSQINRMGAENAGMEFLKGTGETEEASDTVMLCQWPCRLSPDSSKFNNNPHVYTVNIAKNRNGETGNLELFYDAPKFTFAEMEKTNSPF